MYNNPYLQGFREQQPITQNFQLASPMAQNSTFMARFLKEGETPQETFVNSKTALISLSDKKLYIKELDGSMVTYELIMPKDEKDLQIEQLQNQILELKEMISNVPTVSVIETNPTSTEPNTSTTKHGRK